MGGCSLCIQPAARPGATTHTLKEAEGISIRNWAYTHVISRKIEGEVRLRLDLEVRLMVESEVEG